MKTTPTELKKFVKQLNASTETEWRDIDVLDFIPERRKDRHLRYVVTGGCGIVGSWIIRHLLQRGETSVRCMDVKPLPYDLEGLVEFCQVDLRSEAAIRSALRKPWAADGKDGVDVVFHCAGNIRWWERLHFQKKLSTEVILDGASRLLAECEQYGVHKFIYMSSGSVVQEWTHFLAFPGLFRQPSLLYSNTDPVSEPFCHYAAAKAQAEKKTLAHTGNMRTGVIRPAQTIFGSGASSGGVSAGIWPENQYTPILNSNVVQDIVYVENLSIASLLLERHLDQTDGNRSRFTVTNDEPVAYKYFQGVISKYSHNQHQFLEWPAVPFLLLGYLVEWTTYTYWLVTGRNPNFGQIAYMQPTSYSIGQSSAVWDCEDAKNILGYRPAFTVAQGARKFIETWKTDKDALELRPLKEKTLCYHDF